MSGEEGEHGGGGTQDSARLKRRGAPTPRSACTEQFGEATTVGV
jgi:hypothetical protein